MGIRVKPARKFFIGLAIALVFAFVSAFAVSVFKPEAEAEGDAAVDYVATYILGDTSIVDMYGAQEVNGNAAEYGYFTSVETDGKYVHTYSVHSSGWAAAMREGTSATSPVKVVLHTDWTAPRASDTQSSEGRAFNGSIGVPSGVYVYLDLNGCVIDGAQATGVSVIRLENNSYLEIADGAPDKKHLTDETGDPTDAANNKYTYVNNDGETVVIDGGLITGGTSETGGGIYVSAGATLLFSAGTVSGNTAENGGGIYVNDGFIEMKGNAVLCDNYATADGGGINIIGVNGLFTMSVNTVIKDNEASSGGGVCLEDGTFNMEGGVISGNAAENGGGSYCSTGSRVIAHEGRIVGNNATQTGGGVYFCGRQMLIENIDISDNEASYNGGGLYSTNSFISGSSFIINGGSIKGNKAVRGGGIFCSGIFEINDVIIAENTAKKGGGLYTNSNNVPIAINGGSIIGNTATEDGGGVYINTGALDLKGGNIIENMASSKGGGICALGTLNMEGGVISGNTAEFGGGVCEAQKDELINHTITITGGSINGNESTYGGGVYVGYNGEFTLNGGTIGGENEEDGNTAKEFGGGIYICGVNSEIAGGSIVGNVVNGNGGGIYVQYGAQLKISGGEISKNFANGSVPYIGNGGGVYVNGSDLSDAGERNASVEMVGGTISENRASGFAGGGYGGGIYLHYAILNLSGDAQINKNVCDQMGGGVGGTFFNMTMSGGEIKDNVGNKNAAISGNSSTVLTMSGGEICGNVSNNLEPTIDYSIKLKTSGSPKIYGNVAGEEKTSADLAISYDKIDVTGAFTDEARIGIYYDSSSLKSFTIGYSAYNADRLPSEVFFADNAARMITLYRTEAAICAPDDTPDFKFAYRLSSEDNPELASPENGIISFVYRKDHSIFSNIGTGTTVITKNGEPFAKPIGLIADVGEYTVKHTCTVDETYQYTFICKIIITPYDLTDENVVITPETTDFDYTGEAVTLTFEEVSFDGDALQYDVEYLDNVSVGSASAKLTFKGNYTGTKTVGFNISINRGYYQAEWEIYDGGEWSAVTANALEFTFMPGETLKSDRSGRVRVKLTQKSESGAVAGVKYAYAAGIADYKDPSLTESDISEVKTVFAKDGTSVDMLMNVGDYTVSLSGAIEDGYDIIIAGNLAVKIVPFNISPEDEKLDLRVGGMSSLVYDGSEKEATVTIYLDRWLLRENDFAVRYTDNVLGGTAKIKIEFIGNYRGVIEKTFTIEKAENKWETPLNIIRWTYNEFSADENVFMASSTYLVEGETVHFGIFGQTTVRTAGILADIPVELVTDGNYGLCYKVADPTAVAALKGLDAGQYTLRAWIVETSSYSAPAAVEILFNISKTRNEWTQAPEIRAWRYGEYDSLTNAPGASAALGNVVLVVKDENGTTVYDSANGIDQLAAQTVGEYTLTATVAESTNYAGLSQVLTFNIERSLNGWTQAPEVRAWRYGEYDSSNNAPKASSKYGIVVLVVKDGNGTTVYDSANGIDQLAAQTVGEYTLTATVAESDDYMGLSQAFVFNIIQAQNAWADGANDLVLPSWVVGKYNADEVEIKVNAAYGTTDMIITDLDGNEYYNSVTGVDRLSEAPVGKYLLKAWVDGSTNYAALAERTFTFELFETDESVTLQVIEKTGLPWWAVLVIVVGALGVAALIIFLLWKKGVFQLLSGKLVIAIRTKATVDATIAAVRANKVAAEGKKSVEEAKRREREEERRARLEAERALPTDVKAAVLEEKAKITAERSEKMRERAESMQHRAERMKARAHAEKDRPASKKEAAATDDGKAPNEE